jgi:hypothetical protein
MAIDQNDLPNGTLEDGNHSVSPQNGKINGHAGEKKLSAAEKRRQRLKRQKAAKTIQRRGPGLLPESGLCLALRLNIGVVPAIICDHLLQHSYDVGEAPRPHECSVLQRIVDLAGSDLAGFTRVTAPGQIEDSVFWGIRRKMAKGLAPLGSLHCLCCF